MAAPRPPLPRLHDLPALARLALSIAIGVLLAGYGFAGAYLRDHYEPRDMRAGLTIDDIKAAYHGISSRAPLLVALEGGHPADVGDPLPDAQRQALLDWLASDDPSTGYDDFDLGALAPAEIIGERCLSCHSRADAGPSGGGLALEYWDDVKGNAVSTDLEPTPQAIVMQSIHAHAPSMAVVLIAVLLPACMGRWPGWLVGGTGTIAGAGLAADFAGQWMARGNDALAWVIVVGGVAYAAGVALLALLALAEMWLPVRRPARTGG